MGNVIMSGIVPPLEKPVGGTLLSELAVGSTLKLNVNGVAKEFLVVHNGKPSSLYDSSCDGVWLLMKDLYEKRAWDGSDNDYQNSDIHAYLNGTFLNLLDEDVRGVIKQISLPYRKGTGSGSVASGSSGLSTKIFLLSVYELGWTTSNSSYFPVDGAKLDYFTNGTTTAANNLRIAKYGSTATGWWLRSSRSGNTTGVFGVDSSGNYSNYYFTNSYGVRPAFILPKTALITKDGTIIV